MSQDFIPHGYQKKCIKFGVSRPGAAFFLDPGLGKTIVCYSVYEVLRLARHADGLLVISKLRPARKVWPAEIEKWGLKFSCALLHGPKKGELLRQKHDVYVINYEGLPWLEEALRQIKGKKPFDVAVADESSAFRNHNTERWRIMKRLMHYFKRRYGATGSPTPKGLMNLFTQIFWIDAGERLGKRIGQYRYRYFDEVITPYGNDYRPKKGAEKKIYAAIKDVCIRFDDSELDMPMLVTKDIRVDLPDAARARYDELKALLVTEIAGRVVVARNAGIATGKLRQIANGGIWIDRAEKRWAKVHDEKTDAVMDLLEELEGQPLLLGFEFRHEAERLREAFKKRFRRELPTIMGGTPDRVSDRLCDEWNAGDLVVLACQVESVAWGLNLQEGPGQHMCFHSLVWNYEAYDQFIRRIRRQGQRSKRVYLYRIIAEDTTDEALLRAMDARAKTQDELFDALKQHLSINQKETRDGRHVRRRG